MTKTHMFSTRNDLPADVREQMIDLLNQHLADTFDLYSQAKQAHWNVKGMDFFQLHELFDQLAASLLEHTDKIAERATALGGVALGTARMASSNSRLPEYPADVADGKQHVQLLADRYADLAQSLRAAIDNASENGDMDTADLLTEISRSVDKHLWFLEAHLQG